MAKLTERERNYLLMMRGYGDKQRSFQETCDLFNATFNDRNPISKSTVVRTIGRVIETGSVKDRPRSGRPRTVFDDDSSIIILQSFVENPHASIRQISAENEVSISGVHNLLKNQKFHPYKLHHTQELLGQDLDRRMEFCEEIGERGNDFVSKIIFTDEAAFQIDGNVNHQNFRYWSTENPHWMRDDKTQYLAKVNVWTGIIGEHLIGPFFFDENLNAEAYEAMLIQQIIPAIRNLYPNDEFNQLWFQHDGAPAHFALRVRRVLDENFPHRWIGRRGTIEWPPRSPDLTPLDYFLWGYLKERVYKIRPVNIEDLKQRITNEMNTITVEMLRNVRDAFPLRLAHCQAEEGRQFEHLL